MIFTFYILIAFLAFYGLLLLWMAFGFLRTKCETDRIAGDDTPVTVIICARNEERRIGKCLKALLQEDYDLSKVQLIIVNDSSNDSTVFQAQSALKNSNVSYRIISNAERKGKKASILYAMQFAQHELIITRDADTYTTSYSWLKSISEHYQLKKSDLIIGPVALPDNFGLLWAVQAIENNILNLMSCGSAYYKKAFLCSGANLIFTKSIFEKSGAYKKHLSVESGDDVLFLEDVKSAGGKISFLKCEDAIVYTYPCFTFKTLLYQKARWASKFKVNKNFLNRILAAVTLLVNLSWLFSLFYGFLVPQNGGLSLIFVLLKLFIDILLLFLASRFLKNRALMIYALPVGCIYPVYAGIIGIFSFFQKPTWK